MIIFETFGCGYCERDEVFRVSEHDFVMVKSIGLPGLWLPTWTTVTRCCPHCNEESSFGMENEKFGLLIFEVDDD